MGESQVDLRMKWCNYQAAKFAVENWHYSKIMPVGKSVKIGAWEDGQYVGCVMFSYGNAKHLMSPYGLKMEDGCELTRVAMKDHANPVSKMVAIAIRMLKKQSPGLKLIVSFADPFQGHTGAIYQAGNWIYTGVREKTPVFEDKNGRIYHNRTVTATGKLKCKNVIRTVPKRGDLKKIYRPGKHRYLYPLTPETKKAVMKLSKPYPKKIRGSGVTSNMPVDQTGVGGASPTLTLQPPGAPNA